MIGDEKKNWQRWEEKKYNKKREEMWIEREEYISILK